ncbi:hypothetical protein COO91_10953 (plasmid) [Nostoc flagelliforme CCNUN1]|uniref:Uncharacterized protein n=2 Tax=Nostoc flagelliforme TaxID=1306274 RepID=A0A2K8TAU9_9NOSO|nr:hypothetical protein [Nostoc flagelliforme]AUB44713.1 hypothetical protein COO91_10953 [Nostoc flagelliforme CCNUN1]
MLPIEILQELNSCYLKIQAIAQNENWLLLIADKKIDPEAATHLGDVLHYLSEAMGCVEEIVEVKTIQNSRIINSKLKTIRGGKKAPLSC